MYISLYLDEGGIQDQDYPVDDDKYPYLPANAEFHVNPAKMIVDGGWVQHNGSFPAFAGTKSSNSLLPEFINLSIDNETATVMYDNIELIGIYGGIINIVSSDEERCLYWRRKHDNSIIKSILNVDR